MVLAMARNWNNGMVLARNLKHGMNGIGKNDTKLETWNGNGTGTK